MGNRKKATNDFENDFWKLLCYAVFGKTMENIRNRINFKMTNTPKQFSKLIKKPTFKEAVISSEDLVGKEKEKIVLNKPIYCDQAILDISKVMMYDFLYDYCCKK